LTHKCKSVILYLTQSLKINTQAGKEMETEIEKIIQKAEQEGMAVFGLRLLSEPCQIGSTIKNSCQVGDSWNGDELDGASCITLSYDGFEIDDINGDLKQLDQYKSDECQIILVGGTGGYEGTDADEIVIKNPVCLYIF